MKKPIYPIWTHQVPIGHLVRRKIGIRTGSAPGGTPQSNVLAFGPQIHYYKKEKRSNQRIAQTNRLRRVSYIFKRLLSAFFCIVPDPLQPAFELIAAHILLFTAISKRVGFALRSRHESRDCQFLQHRCLKKGICIGKKGAFPVEPQSQDSSKSPAQKLLEMGHCLEIYQDCYSPDERGLLVCLIAAVMRCDRVSVLRIRDTRLKGQLEERDQKISELLNLLTTLGVMVLEGEPLDMRGIPPVCQYLSAEEISGLSREVEETITGNVLRFRQFRYEFDGSKLQDISTFITLLLDTRTKGANFSEAPLNEAAIEGMLADDLLKISYRALMMAQQNRSIREKLEIRYHCMLFGDPEERRLRSILCGRQWDLTVATLPGIHECLSYTPGTRRKAIECIGEFEYGRTPQEKRERALIAALMDLGLDTEDIVTLAVVSWPLRYQYILHKIKHCRSQILRNGMEEAFIAEEVANFLVACQALFALEEEILQYFAK